MAVLFHQNLRVFGGGTDARNTAYAAAFAHIKAQVESPGGPGSILVAGGTEIVNNASGALAWRQLALRLGLNQSEVIACGQTALAHGPEFIGIAAHPSLQILSTARILIDAHPTLGCWLHHDIADPLTPEWSGGLPGAISLDYRGVVYLVVRSAALPPFAVGFLHNLYTLEDQRSIVAGKIPQMISLMRSNPAMSGGAGHVFLGGDFNLPPTPRGTARTGQAFPYSIGIAPADLLHMPRGTVAGGTTMSGSLYDYWYSNLAPAGTPTPMRAGYNLTTLDTCPPLSLNGPMSDHLCSMLQVT